MMSKNIMSIEDAFSLLTNLNAPERLIRHAQLVSETAEEIIQALMPFNIALDADFIKAAAVLHDTGKTVHQSELSHAGNCHEEEGEKILLDLGISDKLARCCVSHARYTTMDCSIEELITALSDKLWKGRRDETLELMVIDAAAKQLGRDRWSVYLEFDKCFEEIAMKGDARLKRSVQ